MQPPRDPLTADQLLTEGRALRALARRLLGADGEDALQEGYAAALARPDAAGRLGPWLAGTVRRLAARWRRDDLHRRARESAAARSEADAAGDPARVAEAADTAAAVANAVRALDEPFRTAIVLRYWRGLSPEQLAVELGVPHNTVRSRLQRGLERLRAQLDARYGERPRWCALLAAFSRGEELAIASAAGGGALALGVTMNVKWIVGAAVLVAAVLTVPVLLDTPLPVARAERASTMPPAAVAANAPTATPDEREAARLPEVPAAASSPAVARAVDPVSETVAPWLARFLVVGDDERPIDGASIAISAAKRRPRPAHLEREGNVGNDYAPEPAGDALFELRTDRDGVASLTLDLECVVARAMHGKLRGHHVAVRASRDAVTKLMLVAPILVRGIVRRADGAPAAGATVTATITNALTGPPDPAVADAEGRFTLPGTLHLSYSLRAELHGEQSFDEQLQLDGPNPPEVVLAFPGAVTLRGAVVDPDGQPVANASVRTWREFRPGDPAFRPRDYEMAQTTTGAEGRFTIAVRRHARYQLIASADGHANSEATWVEPTSVRPHADVQVKLQRHARITGLVRHGDGRPFAGVLVAAGRDGQRVTPVGVPEPGDVFPSPAAATTDDGGRFALTVHPGTAWNVVAFPMPGNTHYAFATNGVRPGEDGLVFTIRDEDLVGCVVRGEVLTAADAQPVAAFDVEVVSVDGKSGGRVRPKFDGHRFELPPLPLGRVFAFDVVPLNPARPRGLGSIDSPFAPVRVGPFTTSAAGIELVARVVPFGELRVQVLTADGTPARDVYVGARRDPDIGHTAHAGLRPDRGGRVVSPRRVPGPHRLVVTEDRMPYRVLHELQVVIAPGINPEVIVRLP